MQAVPTQLERAIAAGGETGALVRRLDWSRTPLGPMRAQCPRGAEPQGKHGQGFWV
jgi:hypothetical protein